MAEIRVPVTYSCSGCDTRWSGVGRAHCAKCHATFGGVTQFDAHRRDIKGIGTCLDPAAITNKAGEPTMKLVGNLWKTTAEFDASVFAQ